MIAQLDSSLVRMAPGRAASRLIGYSLFEGRPATTRGRWWNPVVFANLRAASKLSGAHVDQPIFIVGMGRSGTTLLGRILACHPEVGFLNEPKALWHVVRSDEDIIGSYAPPRTGRLYLYERDVDSEVAERAHGAFSWYLRASRSRRLVDKYPELVFRPHFVQEIFPDARFLVAVRSPWPTFSSVTAWSPAHQSDDADWWGVNDQKWAILWTQGVLERPDNADLAELQLGGETDHYIRAAVEWVVTMREAHSLVTSDSSALLVSHDDLVERPAAMVREILDFCQLMPSARTESYADMIVTTPDREMDRAEASERLPETLVSLVDRTWSELEAAA